MTKDDIRNMPDLSETLFILPLFTALAIWSGPSSVLGWLIFLLLVLATVALAMGAIFIVFCAKPTADNPPPEPGSLGYSFRRAFVWCLNFAGFYLAGWHVAAAFSGLSLVLIILCAAFIRGRSRAAISE